MAASKTLTFGSTANLRPYGVLTVTETATSSSANTSTLSIKLVLKRPSAISSSAQKSASCTINDTKYTWNGPIGGSGDLTLISKIQTVKHETDGSKTISIAASIDLDITWGGVALGTISGSSTLALTDIPQYATVTQTLSSRTETSATMKWSSNSTIDYIWYSTNNGSSWTGINVADGTNGTYTISGLSANTTYQIKTRVRRKDSQKTTDSSALSVTTYNYPYCNSMPNFTIGAKLTLGFYNPLGRSITVNILGADGSQISNDTTTGTSISGYNGAVVVDRLYDSIPNAKSGKYQVKVTYGSQVSTKNGGTYTINQNVCKPAVSSVAYKDTNATTTAITENNQLIIQNQSATTFTASLVANNSATLKTAKIAVNGNSYNMTISGTTATVTGLKIDSASNVSATVTVTDSRGLTATKSTTVQMLGWSLPTAQIELYRLNNYYATTYLTANAHYSSVDGKNTIAIQYRYQEAGKATWSDWQPVRDNVQTTMTLSEKSEWTVQVQIKDLFGTTTYNVPLAKGIPIVYFDRLKNSTGFNCFPADEDSLESNGFNLQPSVMTRSLSATITNLAVNTYTIVPLNLDISTGTKLTATSNGGIKVGSGVSKVLVSARVLIGTDDTAGNRHFRIIKNSYSNPNTLAWTFEPIEAMSQDTVTITPTLAEVEEGDVLYLVYYTPEADDDINGGAFGARTSLTVQVVG